MNFRSVLFASMASALFLTSCGDGKAPETPETVTDSASATAPVAPQLSDVAASPEFEGASLKISSVKADKVGNDSTKLSFKFDVKNYELKGQTADAANKMCNNSAQGQHIHFIMDTQPYKALYEPKNEVTVANGTEHYLMVFLSRSYHESVKSPGAAALYHFKISETGTLEKLDDPKTPMVFYSRPKGDYVGADTANILLDFYVWNCTLGADEKHVVADVTSANGATAKFTLDKWAPKFINHLAMGKNKVTLTLTDKEGNPVDGPCTSATREFNLAAGEPMK
ncbi:MAG: hypothetical protein KF744_15090 [Taibaiella sp.]|nr:hypothetical protein [Taibaiella sp.]